MQLSEIVSPLLSWYWKNARDLPWRKNIDPYRIWVSEIMLQQTRVDAVKPYFERFMDTFPTIQSLAQADSQLLMKCWEGLGYYSRARNLQRAAQLICTEYGGMFPTQYTDVLSLPGIGPYTAGAICSIAFGQPTPAVDGNVLRVITRLTENSKNIADPACKKEITLALRKIYPKQCGDFTQSLMELGALICIPGTPDCKACPLQACCKANINGTQSDYPRMPIKKTRKKQDITVFLLYTKDKTALCKRSNKGLLQGMWEFPNIEEKVCIQKLPEKLSELGIVYTNIGEPIYEKHVFTHIQWDMTAYPIRCVDVSETYLWATMQQIAEKYSLPTAFRKFLKYVPI